ncbi:helix-turn-helix domain-containing protein [Streptantibioticus ferralitis]|uniref:Helix-turn-helix transcriptional regulator n=1 Tax=Streptantibioticus ferralitis TaxID=236510 RepID=A0ABT5YS00_9ACTN|nr:helix-turn-helix transcriptional regulator [Streptantibioticus ferralitis]MDF2254377.1 helix-turn-helix transcriptional regulator [Streptantibioticus ferralitis]
MPARHFDGKRVRAARRALDLTQDDVGAALDVSRGTIAGYEANRSFPDGYKLPGYARVLQRPLDELFPRDGEPDLADLRCDAGYPQYKTSEIIGTRSATPVQNAERGVARLDDRFMGPLAAAYGVTVNELLAAQERSFGISTPPPSAAQCSAQALVPRTVTEKINYLLQNAYFGQTPPTDAEIAQAINEAGTTVATADDVRALRTGTETFASPAMRASLARAFQVEPAFFEDGAEVNPAAREVLEGIRFLGSIHQGQILALAARGSNTGLSAGMIAKINELVAELQDKLPDAPGSA